MTGRLPPYECMRRQRPGQRLSWPTSLLLSWPRQSRHESESRRRGREASSTHQGRYLGDLRHLRQVKNDGISRRHVFVVSLLLFVLVRFLERNCHSYWALQPLYVLWVLLCS